MAVVVGTLIGEKQRIAAKTDIQDLATEAMSDRG